MSCDGSRGTLPNMNRVDPRWPKAGIDDLRLQDDFDVLATPICRKPACHFVYVLCIDQKLSGGNSSTACNASRHQSVFVCIGIDEPRNNRIILISRCLQLLRPVNEPLATIGFRLILDPKACHLGVVCEMKPQRRGETQCPTIVIGADENRWSPPPISQMSVWLSLKAV